MGRAYFRTNSNSNINLILCTVRDHRSKEVIEHLIFTVKAKLMVMTFNERKPPLDAAMDIPKIFWREAVHRTGITSSRDKRRDGLRKGTINHNLVNQQRSDVQNNLKNSQWITKTMRALTQFTLALRFLELAQLIVKRGSI